MKGRPLAWLCCLVLAAALSGSAAQNAFPIPEPAAAVPDSSAAPGPVGIGAPVAETPEAVGQAGGGAAPAPQAPAPAPGAEAPTGTDPAAVAHTSSPTQPVPLGAPGPWHLVFNDNFDTLNTAVWTPYWFNDCSPKSYKNNVMTCSSNVKVAGGEAVLQLSDAASGALLSTNPNDGVPGHTGLEFTNGYVEARIYFPGTCSTGIHNWAAWWTAGQQFPSTGEADIAEPLTGSMWSVYHSAVGKKARIIPGCWAGSYHTYGLHRKGGVNDVYYDGVLVHSYVTSDGNSPHYLLLNVGVWRGLRIVGEQGSMRVDYVRMWQ